MKFRPSEIYPHNSGCVAEDLAKILVVCANSETRRSAESVVFDAYYSVITADMAEAGRTVPFTRQQVRVILLFALDLERLIASRS